MKVLRLCAILILICAAAFAKPIPWTPGHDGPLDRPGSIQHAINAADGTPVLIDCTKIVKVRPYQSPAYIVIQDDWDEGLRNLVVEFCPNKDLHLGQTVEVSGEMATVDGQRRVRQASVNGYAKNDEINYLSFSGSKPTNEYFTWAGTKVSLAGSGCPNIPAIVPTNTPEVESEYFSTIAALKIAPDGTRVWIYNKKVINVGTDTYGPYAILAADGSNDHIRVYTSTYVSTADRAWVVDGLLGTLGGERVVSTDIGPHADFWLSIPKFATFDAGSIVWAKGEPDNARVNLAEKIVLARFPDCVYIGEPGSVAGLKVLTTRSVPIGRVVNVVGTMLTSAGERFVTPTSLNLSASPSVEPKPVGLTNRSLGGGGWAVNGDGETNGQSGVEGGIGLNTIGMIVRVWGNVTEIAADKHSYWIDDGTQLSQVDNGSVHSGVKISTGYDDQWIKIDSLQVGDFVAINGVSSCWTEPGGGVYRSVRQLGAFGKAGAPWWLLNRLNPVDGLSGDQK